MDWESRLLQGTDDTSAPPGVIRQSSPPSGERLELPTEDDVIATSLYLSCVFVVGVGVSSVPKLVDLGGK